MFFGPGPASAASSPTDEQRWCRLRRRRPGQADDEEMLPRIESEAEKRKVGIGAGVVGVVHGIIGKVDLTWAGGGSGGACCVGLDMLKIGPI